MVGYPYQYGDDLSQEEATERLKMVALGFSVAIALNLLKVKAANAVDTAPKPPSNPGGVQPQPSPPTKPPNSYLIKNGFAGLATAFCTTAINSGSFWVGFLCGVVVLAGIGVTKNVD